jgi:hypothetical protein
MSQFGLFLQEGFRHILDLNGFDHILFVLSLCARYTMRDWRKLLILVTAFTFGHSLTLALAVLRIVHFGAGLIEFLIPLTILITCLYNILRPMVQYSNSRVSMNYVFATFFGLIHGLGFSNYLLSLLGRGSKVLVPLLSFNLGVEFGQLLIVAIYISIAGILVGLGSVNKREWVIGLSAAVGGMSFMLLLDNKIW